MGWLARLFGKGARMPMRTDHVYLEQDISYVGPRMIRIRSRDFFGQYSTSPDGKYILTWRDQDVDGDRRGGFRESGLGDYLLLRDDKAIVEGRLECPWYGKVANNGTFILHDEHFGDNTKATLYAFDAAGARLFSRTLSANLINNGLSSNGRFTICQTANSDTNDGNRLTLFDLVDREALWSIIPPSGLASSYEFDVPEAVVYLIYNDGGRYAYSMTDGDFMDWERWEENRIDHGGPFEQIRIAKGRLKVLGANIDLRSGYEIVFIINKAIANGLDKHPAEHAKALKILGEVWETLGNPSEALKCYEKAIAIDPEVGVKRKIHILREEK